MLQVTHLLMLLLLCVVLGPGSVLARFTFNSGSIQNFSIPVTTMTTFLGPQLGDPALHPVTGPVQYFAAGDPCKASAVPDSVAGKIVFVIVPGLCPDCIIYDNFAAKQAAAVVVHSPFVPGRKAYARSLYDTGRRANTMMYLDAQVTPRLLNPALRAQNLTATIMPDHNQWIDMYQSWWYWAFTSSVPMGFIMVILYQCVGFLARHLELLYLKYLNLIPETRRSLGRMLAFMFRNATSLHIVCALQIISKTILFLLMITGPYMVSTVWPYEIQQFFYSHLIGLEVAILIITAVYYHQIISAADTTSRSVIFQWVPAIVLSVLAVVLDTIMTTIRALYYDVIYPNTVIFSRSYNCLFLFLGGVYTFISAVTFQVHFRSVQKSPDMQRRMQDPVIQRFLTRITTSAILMTIALLMHTIVTFLLTIRSAWIFVPDNYGIMFSMLVTFKNAQSLLMTQMLRPKSRRPGESGQAVGTTTQFPGNRGQVASRSEMSTANRH